MKYIIAIDQGTTSSRVIIFNEKCQSIFVEQAEFESIFPQPGWVEQDAVMIYNDIVKLLKTALTKTQIKKEAKTKNESKKILKRKKVKKNFTLKKCTISKTREILCRF